MDKSTEDDNNIKCLLERITTQINLMDGIRKTYPDRDDKKAENLLARTLVFSVNLFNDNRLIICRELLERFEDIIIVFSGDHNLNEHIYTYAEHITNKQQMAECVKKMETISMYVKSVKISC